MAENSYRRPLLEPSLSNASSKPKVHGVAFAHSSLRFLRVVKSHGRSIAVALGPIGAALVLGFVRISSLTAKQDQSTVAMLAVMLWMCIWWVTEAVPIAVTALLPILLYPLFEIQDANSVAKAYFNDTISLFIGSFMLALAVERYQVHRRLAVKILMFFGGKRMEPRLLMLGFCVGPAFVSMWISNTAAAIMMMPVCLGVLEKMQSAQLQIASAAASSEGFEVDVEIIQSKIESLPEEHKEVLEAVKVYGRGVVLAVAYAVALGGLTTLTGTGTNMVLVGVWNGRFPKAPPVSYLNWFLFAFPLGVILLLFLWILLCIIYCPPSAVQKISRSFNKSALEEELEVLGPITFAETTVLSLFGMLIVLWMTRTFSGTMPGWGSLFKGLPGDGTAAIIMAIPLFIIPNKRMPGEKLMSWKHCKNLPWDIVLLLGGGFAVADGFAVSGLSAWMTAHLDFLKSVPYLLMVPIICLFVGITTEFVSNTSTATIFLPLLLPVALLAHIHPLFYMVPATIAASFAFMLPIGTPPDAVAYATGYVSMVDMISTGFYLKVFSTIALSILMPTLGNTVYGLSKAFHGY